MNQSPQPSTRINGLRKGLMACAALAAMTVAPGIAHAELILAFSQLGTANTVTGTASNGVTTISTTDTQVVISALAAPGAPTLAFLTFNAVSNSVAQLGSSGNVRQNYDGTFSITSGTNGTGTNYLSGSFKDLFEGLNAAATLVASTPPASNVTFTSSVIPDSDLQLDRAVSFSFTAVTPGINAPVNGTIPSFTASISGNFSADNVVAVPEPVSLALLGFGAAGVIAARRRKVN